MRRIGSESIYAELGGNVVRKPGNKSVVLRMIIVAPQLQMRRIEHLLMSRVKEPRGYSEMLMLSTFGRL